MAGNIKGITIEFRGDTTKLNKALAEVNKESRSLDKELKGIDRALKFNPGNVQLMRQKFETLGEKVQVTQTKLEALRKAQAKMDDDPAVDKTSQDYRELQREIIEAESQLKHFNAEQKKIQAALSPLGQFSAKMSAVSEGLTKAGNAMKPVSAAGAAVTAGLGTMAYKAGVAADDLNTLAKVTGLSTKELQKYGVAADLVDVDVDTIAKTHVKLTSSMAKAQKGNKTATAAFEALGVSITNADGSLRDSDTVWQETIKALSNVKNETERETLAMDLMGKQANKLNPLIADGGETYEQMAKMFEKYDLELVDQETLDKANDFNDSIDRIKAVGTLTLSTLGMQLAGYLAPALEKVVGFVGTIAEQLTKLSPQTLTIIAIIGGVVAAIAPLLIIAGKVAAGISAISGAMALMNPIVLAVIGVITALVAVGVLLYKNWDKIRAFGIKTWTKIKTFILATVNAIKTSFANLKSRVDAIWNAIRTKVSSVAESVRSTAVSKFKALRTTVSETISNLKSKVDTVFAAIGKAMSDPIGTAKAAIEAAIRKVKEILSTKLSFPKISLPKFSLKGKFSLNPPSVPSIDVSWNADGAIFTRPTVLQGVGEAGAEAVLPLDKLWKEMDKIYGSRSGNTVTINVYPSAGQDPKQIAAEVERRMTRALKQKQGAWA